MKNRLEKLKTIPVVGVTCAACVFKALENMSFPFVILDECFQVPEPLVKAYLPLTHYSESSSYCAI